MKKLIAIVLMAAMLVACFASCGGNDSETASGTDSQTTTETLIMATNATFPPYEYYQEDDIVGIDAEIAQAIADKLGMKLEIVDTEFGSIIGGVQSGKYDIGMAGMTVTDERKESVNFSAAPRRMVCPSTKWVVSPEQA